MANPADNNGADEEQNPQDDSNTSQGDGAPKKAVRTSRPKARTGCVTCKIRHVKCDETKPECNRCLSTGRKCDGYYIKPRKKKESRQVVRKSPALVPTMGQDELVALDYFYYKTAPALSSYFDADFWTRLVFQMSYVEPSIRHAMSAVASLHRMRDTTLQMVSADVSMLMPPLLGPSESSPSSNSGTSSTASGSISTASGTSTTFDSKRDVENGFALTQYNRAIGHLATRMDGSAASMQVTLLVCILFVCIESLRGDRASASKHVRAGMNIAMTLLSRSDSTPATGLYGMETFKDSMIPMFYRLELLAAFLGYESSWEYPVDVLYAVPNQFNTMKEARDSLVHLGNHSIRFIRSLRGKRWAQALTAEDYTKQATLINKFEQWRIRLDEMIFRESLSDRDLEGSKVLRLHYMVGTNWLMRCMSLQEPDTDAYIDYYEKITELAESIFQTSGTTGPDKFRYLNDSTFTCDIEIVSPLFYVAKQCRQPVIRRRAIALLKQTQRREGPWDSYMAAVITERIMLIEEASLTVLDGSQLPPLCDRVWRTSTDPELGTNPKRNRIDIYTRPDGLKGHWRTWTEELTIHPNNVVGLTWEQAWASPPQERACCAKS